MLLNNKQVAVIGAGPGGLTLARLLQMNGVRVTVYERDRDKHARVQGSPLDLHDGSGLAAIQAAGLLNEFKSNFLPGADKLQIMNEQAEVFFSDHEIKQEENFGDAHFRPEIDRGTLRKLLLDSLHTGTVIWDSHFQLMEQQDTGWMLQFKNGSSAYADIVVAADGANSKIRPYLTDIKPFYTGITMLEGNIYNAKEIAPHINALIKGGKIMAFGNGKNLLMGQKGNGDIGFYASFKTDENWAAASGIDFNDRAQVLAWFNAYYPEWSHIWDELFETTATPFVPRPIYCAPFDQSWNALPNLTLLGDAAHVMPPFAGEGANMAMLDALELHTALTAGQYTTLQEAIEAYEMIMRTNAAAAAKESFENGKRMHATDALQHMLNMFAGH